MSVVEFRKVLSEHVLPKALQRGVGRQRGSREASMSRHALDSVLRDVSPGGFEYTYAILYCLSMVV